MCTAGSDDWIFSIGLVSGEIDILPINGKGTGMILFGDINKGLRECRSTPGSVLVDVRERTEFASGHIAGAVNEPLSTIRNTALPKNEPIFLYCLRGSRSRKAAGILKKMPFGPHRESGPKPSLRSGTPLRGWVCTFCHHWMW